MRFTTNHNQLQPTILGNVQGDMLTLRRQVRALAILCLEFAHRIVELEQKVNTRTVETVEIYEMVAE